MTKAKHCPLCREYARFTGCRCDCHAYVPAKAAEPLPKGELCVDCDSLIKNFHWDHCPKNTVNRKPTAHQGFRHTGANPPGRPKKFGSAWS